jgi:hypothetical protein
MLLLYRLLRAAALARSGRSVRSAAAVTCALSTLASRRRSRSARSRSAVRLRLRSGSDEETGRRAMAILSTVGASPQIMAADAQRDEKNGPRDINTTR